MEVSPLFTKKFLCVNTAVPPSITASPERIVELLSPATLFLTCSADGLPLPNLSWSRTLSNGSEMVFSMTSTTEGKRNFTIYTNSNSTVQSTIVLEHTLAKDTANYSCRAINRLGDNMSRVSSVSIYGKQYPLGCRFMYYDIYHKLTFD